MPLNLKRVSFRPDYDTLIGLSTEEYEQLLDSGELVWSPPLRAKARDLALVYDADASDFDFLFEPQADLDLFLERARLVKMVAEPQSALILHTPTSLRDVLLTALSDIKMDFLQEKRHRWLIGRSCPFPATVLTEEAKSALRSTGNFYGMAGVCKCGEPICASSYGWIKDRVVLFSVEMDGSVIDEVGLFPCRIDL
jgi:hypothetical protein